MLKESFFELLPPTNTDSFLILFRPPQFLIIIFFNSSSLKFNIYEKDWSKFDTEIFILDYFSIDWDQALVIDKSGIGKS